MPRNVRPAWIETRVDDGPTKGQGPRSRKDGRAEVTVKVRCSGAPLDVIEAVAQASSDGSTVKLTVRDARNGNVLFAETFAQ